MPGHATFDSIDTSSGHHVSHLKPIRTGPSGETLLNSLFSLLKRVEAVPRVFGCLVAG